MSTGEVDANGVRLHCQVDGRDGAPWLVFSNAIMTDLTLWDGQVAALAGDFRILRYDQRGHGRSGSSSGPCTFDLLADDLTALCDAFQIERAVLAGISMGGVTALRAAQRHPSRAAAVIACDAQWSAPATAPAAWNERIDIAVSQGMAALEAPTIQRWFTPAFVASQPPALALVGRMIRNTPVDGFTACARALRDYDIRPGFSRLTMPVCLIAGAADGTVPGVMRDMQDALPAATFVEIAAAGHLPNIEQPAEVNRAMADFLRRVPAAPTL